jgi:hypothetical protein
MWNNRKPRGGAPSGAQWVLVVERGAFGVPSTPSRKFNRRSHEARPPRKSGKSGGKGPPSTQTTKRWWE